MTDDRPHRVERADGPAQIVANRGVVLHQRVLLPRQLALLQQHPIGDRDLADVVEKGAAMQRLEIGLVQGEMPAERGGVIGQPLAVPFGARIARLDDPSEREKQ